jgi:hypothetical protein
MMGIRKKRHLRFRLLLSLDVRMSLTANANQYQVDTKARDSACPQLAHRGTLRYPTTLAGFGVKRTFSEPRSLTRDLA